MGGQESVERSGQWHETQQRDNDHVVVRDDSGREGEQYHLTVPGAHCQTQMQAYQLRSTAKAPLVHVYLVECEQGSPARLRVITERVTHRLRTAPQLTFPECLYILGEALEGYQVLFEQTGAFRVTDLMVGFTAEGEARVWLNSHLAINQPQYPKQSLKVASQTGATASEQPSCEQFQVQEVFLAVEQKCLTGKYPEPFRSHIDQLNFQQAKQLVRLHPNLPTRVDLFRNKIISL